MGKIIKLPFNDSQVIPIGWTGQNEYEEVAFDISKWLKKFPNGVVRVFYRLNSDGNLYPIADITTSTYIWKPQAADFPRPGRYSAQAIMESGTTIGKSDIFYFDIKKSLDHLNQISDDPPPEYPPSYIQKIMQDMEALTERAESAAEHVPYYEDGTLYVWDEETQQFVEFSLDIDDAVEKYFDKHPIEINETDPTVPGWAKQPDKPSYTAEEVGALPADTPIPAAVTEQTVAGWGFTKNTGTYSKPSGGIPASDLADGVIPVVPQMATQTDMSDWTQGKTVDAAVLKTTVTAAGMQVSALEDDVSALERDKANASDIPTAVSELTNDSGYQTAQDVQTAIDPFVIPITSDGEGIYSTTVSAEEIVDNADNCRVNFIGSDFTPMSIIKQGQSVNISFVLAVIQYGALVSLAISIDADKSNNSINVSVAFSAADLLPAVAASDNGKFLRVVSGAWAAQSVPAAESNSFGGGS